MNETTTTTFSKKQYLSGLRCVKQLHLQAHQPELAKSEDARAIMEQGKIFEIAARELLFPNGIDMTSVDGNKEDFIERTSEEMKNEKTIIYQATFRTESGEITMVDVLVKNGEKIQVFEMKGTTQLLDLHFYDLSFQWHVITSLGFKIESAGLVYVNKDYVRQGELSSEFALVEDATKIVRRMQLQIGKKIERFKKVIRQKETPETDIGHHCLDYKLPACQFKNHCFSGLPTNNIFEVRSMRTSKKLGLYYQGITTMQQLADSGTKLTDGQMIQVTCALDNSMVTQPNLLSDWLAPLMKAKEIAFLDFETVAGVVPLDGWKSFAQSPFQYSLHVKKSEKIVHSDFLANPKKEDSRREFIEALLSDLDKHDSTAPIIVYNASFEVSVLKNLAKLYPDLEAEIKSVTNRVVDLMVVFKDKMFYSESFRGSYSIKAVLPVLCPELSYKDLKVGNGAAASYEFIRMQNLDENEAEQIAIALKEYCKLDTLAMVKILDYLFQFISTHLDAA